MSVRKEKYPKWQFCKYCGERVVMDKWGKKSFGTNQRETYHLSCISKVKG